MNDEAVITLLLMDGTASGAIKCTRDNWNGVAFKIPRTEVGALSGREDLKQTGVYLLLGTDEESGQSAVYVGQGVSPFEWTRRIDQAAGATVTAVARCSKALGDK